MKFLITGITGFAGPHLANLLIAEGHDVYGLVRHSNGRETDILDIVSANDFSKIKFVYGDLRNYLSVSKVFEDNKFDGVFHLAAQSHPPTSFINPIGTMEENVMGSTHIIQAIEKNDPETKLMFCSTSEVYGNVGKDRRKIQTTDTLLPANPYGASKDFFYFFGCLSNCPDNKRITKRQGIACWQFRYCSRGDRCPRLRFSILSFNDVRRF